MLCGSSTANIVLLPDYHWNQWVCLIIGLEGEDDGMGVSTLYSFQLYCQRSVDCWLIRDNVPLYRVHGQYLRSTDDVAFFLYNDITGTTKMDFSVSSSLFRPLQTIYFAIRDVFPLLSLDVGCREHILVGLELLDVGNVYAWLGVLGPL